jgi:hypothetical protein
MMDDPAGTFEVGGRGGILRGQRLGCQGWASVEIRQFVESSNLPAKGPFLDKHYLLLLSSTNIKTKIKPK